MATKSKNVFEAEAEQYEEIQTKFEAYTGDEPYLFISYSHRDTKKVYPILDALYDKKYRLWYDESCETGNDFRDELRDRIEKCEAVILFVSESSMASPFCGMEVIVARENNKRLYPVYLDNMEVPPAFQILLANTHHSTADNMEKLVKAMVRDLPAVTMDRLIIEDDVLISCADNGLSIEVDDGVREIAHNAFIRRTMLHNIKLPDSVLRIDDCAFRGCEKLEKVIIPDSVKELGWGLFDGCENTVTVYCDEGSAIQDYCIRNGIKQARISEKGND